MPKVGSSEVAIVSAVAVLSCNSSPSRIPNDNETAASSVVVVAPGPAATAAQERSVEGAAEASGSRRIAALRGNPSWDRFKRIWRELDDVAPRESKGSLGELSYVRSLDHEQAPRLSQQADDALRRLSADQLLSDGEADFLRRTMQLRIGNMTHGFMPLMMMHRMPAPFETEQASSAERLERKLDVLVKLRTDGKIGSKEFDLALEETQREAITLYVASAMVGQGYAAPAIVHPVDGEAFLAEMERKLGEARADGGADGPTARFVEESKALVPAIRGLVAELER